MFSVDERDTYSRKNMTNKTVINTKRSGGESVISHTIPTNTLPDNTQQKQDFESMLVYDAGATLTLSILNLPYSSTS